ncbi:hypothetical protein L0337_02410 [candidate division KSB1 bacterium]|nr:hypothetical protein [candidate division KSB1 bacterium]
MTPFHPTFRRLLRRNIPQVRDEDLNRHESLFALRQQLVIDKHIVAEKYVPPPQQGPQVQQQQERPPEPSYEQPPCTKGIDDDIADATSQAQAIFAPYSKVYDASLRLWVARRQIVLKQGNFFQIPLSLGKIWKLIRAIWDYRKAQIRTLPTIAANRVKKVSLIRVMSFIVFIALLLSCLYALMPRKPQPDQVQQEQIR